MDQPEDLPRLTGDEVDEPCPARRVAFLGRRNEREECVFEEALNRLRCVM